MIDNLKKVFNNDIDEVYYLGLLDLDDKEFIINSNYLLIELDNMFIELEAIKGYGKLRITVSNTITNKNIVDDVVEGKVEISNIIFTNPLSASKRVKTVSLYNLETELNALISDVLFLELVDGQVLFIDPGFLGITVGGLEQKNYWYDNLSDIAKVQMKILEIHCTI